MFWYTTWSGAICDPSTRLVFALKPCLTGALGACSARACSCPGARPRTGNRSRGGGTDGGTAPLGRREAGSAALSSSAATWAATARRDRGAETRTGTTRPFTSLAIVADAGTRCGRPAAVPHCWAGGADDPPVVTITAKIPSARHIASAATTATVRRAEPRTLRLNTAKCLTVGAEMQVT